jgi:hypothetical protein
MSLLSLGRAKFVLPIAPELECQQIDGWTAVSSSQPHHRDGAVAATRVIGHLRGSPLQAQNGTSESSSMLRLKMLMEGSGTAMRAGRERCQADPTTTICKALFPSFLITSQPHPGPCIFFEEFLIQN